jgi:16S rRNA (adenine1518-N6/adenine1519-N6)-dimethyltransferase
MPLTPTETVALLASLGHRPRAALGQNFLIEGNIVRKSLELAGVSEGSTVVEVGPGLGTLTQALLAAGAEVWAIELDPRLHAHLESTLGREYPARLHLMSGDAVEEPLAGLPSPKAESGEFSIVANLPYAISSPWLDGVLSGPLPSAMVLMLQEESAARFTAAPGSKAFGPISIMLQAAYRTEGSHRVSPQCFLPRPDVGSRLLRLGRLPNPFRFSGSAKSLIRRCFQNRRKQVARAFRENAGEAAERLLGAIEQYGYSGKARPEELPVPLWIHLSQLLPSGAAGAG